MSGREYYNDVKVVPATATNTYADLSLKSRGLLIISPLTGITIKTRSGEEVALSNVLGSLGTNQVILPYSVAAIKSTAISGIPANRVYELF